MAGHALHGDGGVDELVDLAVGIIQCFQVGRDFQGVVEGHLELHGDELGHLVHILIGQAHDTAHVAHRIAGRHGAEGHDLGHMVPAVLFVDVVDDLLAALIAEVHVKVGHGDSLGVEEPFEDQVVADGVDVGDAHAVGRQTARAGTAPRAHRDALALGVIDEVENDEVVIGIAHRLDDVDLVFQALPQLIGDLAGIAAFQALPAELLEVILVFHAAGGFEVGQLGLAELKVEVAHLGDAVGVLTGVGGHGEEIVHLVGALEIELVGLELHPVNIGDGLARLDAEKNALHLGVLFADVVGVVGRHQRDARLPRQPDELGQDDPILLQAVVLQFNIVIALTEQVVIVQCRLLGPLVVPCQDGLGDLPRQAGRQADQTLVVLLQQLLVDAGLGVKAFQETGGYHLDEVFVAGFILAQQNQVVVAVHPVDLVKAGAGRHIDLAADDGLDARRHRRVVKLHAAVHDAVVGDGDGRLPHLLETVKHPVDAAGTVQQAVLGVHMKMGELSFCFRHCLTFFR